MNSIEDLNHQITYHKKEIVFLEKKLEKEQKLSMYYTYIKELTKFNDDFNGRNASRFNVEFDTNPTPNSWIRIRQPKLQ